MERSLEFSPVDIVDKPYEIIDEPKLLSDDGDHGKTISARCLIKVDVDQHPSQLRDTIWHELLHAMWFEGGLSQIVPEDEKEEMCVRVLATLSLYCLRKNPKLVKVLLAKD